MADEIRKAIVELDTALARGWVTDGPRLAEATREVRRLLIQTDWQLRNLLAIIHRDGGHYTEEHGLEKSCADAEELSSWRCLAEDEMKRRNSDV